jgi:hypothetical protein
LNHEKGAVVSDFGVRGQVPALHRRIPLNGEVLAVRGWWHVPVLIAVLGLVFFTDLVLHPTQTLYSDRSDLLTENLPAKQFLVRSWQETGEVPLWCPYSYAGLPFLHDIKVGAFYPLHLLLYWLPERWLGAALSWLVVLHVILAGWCMYAYARFRNLGRAGALVAAIGYMFAGKWLLHLLAGGHYILTPLAWLPLVLLWLEQAIQRRSLLRATWAGGAFALIVLGAHPQLTLYVGVFIAVWTLGAVLAESGRRAALGRWLGLGLWTVLVAAALAAVELLPAIEAAGEASRTAGVASDDEATRTVGLVLELLGPSLTTTNWENQGGFGILWVAVAALAPLLCLGRVRFEAAVLVGLVVFALGGGSLLQWAPGFQMFQLHVRMLLPATLAVAFLAGTTTDVLFEGPALTPLQRRRCRRVLLQVALAGLALVGVKAILLLSRENLHPHIYWLALLVTLPAAWWLLRAGERQGSTWKPIVWGGILLADLWAMSWPLLALCDDAEIHRPSACVAFLAKQRDKRGRVLDRGVPDRKLRDTSTPLDPALPLILRIESLKGFNSVDVRRYREYLQFITDRDAPLVPREGAFGFPIFENFPIKNKSLLDLLGVRYLLQPSDIPLDSPGWEKVYEDPHPEAYQVIAGGRQPLRPYRVYENAAAFPRAFIVPRAEALPERSNLLKKLKNTDFKHTVLLEPFAATAGATTTGQYREAEIREYEPNRVVVALDGKTSGYLVLADLWFPGWACTIDGQPAKLYRANYLFRGVEVRPGTHEVVFTFTPNSYRWGKIISATALALLVLATLLKRPLVWSRITAQRTVTSVEKRCPH